MHAFAACDDSSKWSNLRTETSIQAPDLLKDIVKNISQWVCEEVHVSVHDGQALKHSIKGDLHRGSLR